MKKIFFCLVSFMVLLSVFQAEGATYTIQYTTSNNTKISPQGTFANSAGTALSFTNTTLGKLSFTQEVKSIGSYAFHNCPKLTSVTLPDCVTSVGYFAFSSCTSLTSPVCNAHIFARLNTSYSGAYSINEGIDRISSSAFYQCTSLSSVTIPASVTVIEEYAFAGCTGLASIYVAEVPAAVQSNTFNNVSKKSCVVYVPKGCVDAYRAAAYWKAFENIQEVAEEPAPDEEEPAPTPGEEDPAPTPGEGENQPGDNTGDSGETPDDGTGGGTTEDPTYTDAYKLEFYPMRVNSYTQLLLTNGRPIKKIEFDVTRFAGIIYVTHADDKAVYGVTSTAQTSVTHVVVAPSEVIPVGSDVSLFRFRFYNSSSTLTDVVKASLLNIIVTDQDGVEHAVSNYTTNVYFSADAKMKTTNDGEAPYIGNYATDAALSLMNKSLPDNALIIDLTSVSKLPEGALLTPPNPNTMIYANSGLHLGNTSNVIMDDICQNFALTDGYSYKLVRDVFAHQATYTRKMSSEWGTLCLPYDVTSDNNVKYYEIASYNASAESSTLWLEPVAVLSAGTPGVCRRMGSDQNVTFHTSATDVLAQIGTEPFSAHEGLSVHGTSQFTTINPSSAATGYSAYYIASNCFWQVTGDVSVQPYRCWFEIATGANQAPFRLALGDESTGLESIECVGVSTDQIYDMQGLPHAAPVNGLQILNGCKVWLRE